MKRMIALFVLTVLLAAAIVMAGAWGSKHNTPSAGWTWDESAVASSSVSTINIVQATDATEDGAWGS